jgi:hypothetical protein
MNIYDNDPLFVKPKSEFLHFNGIGIRRLTENWAGVSVCLSSACWFAHPHTPMLERASVAIPSSLAHHAAPLLDGRSA